MTSLRIIKFGDYFLTRRIAMGGMAELYRARKIGPAGFEKLVAVKRLLPHLAADPEFREMFLNEARLASLLTHQNIVQVYDLGRMSEDEALPPGHQGTYFIAMEYVSGRSLAEVMKRGQERNLTLPVELAARVALAAAAGLAYAHERRDEHDRPLELVHRDVSPQNILISYEGEVKLVDFGIAKALSHSATTRPGTLKGKFAYMSPEQARGDPVDRRSDLYSLGIVLWEMLTGERLYAGDTDAAILNQVLNQAINRPSGLRPEIPEDLEVICLRCLARDPDGRYADAQSLVRDLEAFLYSLKNFPSTYSLRNHLYEMFGPEIEAEKGEMEEELAEARRAAAGHIVAGGVPAAAGSGPAAGATRVLKSGAARGAGRAWLAAGIASLLAVLAVAYWLWPQPPPAPQTEPPRTAVGPAAPAPAVEPAPASPVAAPSPAGWESDPRLEEARRAIRQGRHDEALALLIGLAHDHPEAEPALGRELARARLGRAAQNLAASPETAREDLAEALNAAPDWAEAHLQAGRLLTRLGDPDQALTQYQRALDLDPGQEVALFNRGYLLLEKGRCQEAIADFQRVVDLDSPHAADALVNQAVCYSRLGDQTEAAKRLKAALVLNPNHKLALSHLQKLNRLAQPEAGRGQERQK